MTLGAIREVPVVANGSYVTLPGPQFLLLLHGLYSKRYQMCEELQGP